ncbi:mannose-6-phosphate isomerase, class I [Lysinibacter cavernae]|uniref:mannose-6-phosphate isomerase n=1 Tax=Lysinibacter cavernae TaxID=1640652 RepID=A0A7X5TTX6_9MICO|nr:mannose-6-phosphate isomerase, class I [Lysinibacter cavernae]NIH55086.1 mannose-6-phosphate isomerase [Lysinibacter cavernae]
MLVQIANTTRDYAWGSTSAIPKILGLPVSEVPRAELWLGTHERSPSWVVHPDGANEALGSWLARMGSPTAPRFLMKILAAARPLSLQVHPSTEQAIAGYEREDAAGIPLDADHRNYRDRSHKPEVVVALSETFEALSGFRPLAEVASELQYVLAETATNGSPQFAEAAASVARFLFDIESESDTLAEEARRPALTDWLFCADNDVFQLQSSLERLVRHLAQGETVSPNLVTFLDLSTRYPGDPGALISLLLHRVTLHKGEALFLPAGNIHAYLEGTGVEVMASSDNVLRGGLTAKHIDTAELSRVLDFSTLPVPLLAPTDVSPGITAWQPAVDDFCVWRATPSANAPVSVIWQGTLFGIVVEGSVVVTTPESSLTLVAGQCFAGLLKHPEAALLVSGSGTVFVATAGTQPA